MSNRILNLFDILALIGLSIISLAAIAMQFVGSELPCALCVMQRMGFYAIGYGLMLNLIKGRHSKHYLLVILASMITSFMGGVQVLLHIVPGTGSYGDPVLQMHMYTWTVVLCIAYIFYGVLAGLLAENDYSFDNHKVSKITQAILIIFVLSLVVNIISAFFECGPYLCPSDPQSYWLIDLFTGHTWVNN